MQGSYSAGILRMLGDFTFLDLFSERCSVAGAVATCAADFFRALCHDVLLCRPKVSKVFVGVTVCFWAAIEICGLNFAPPHQSHPSLTNFPAIVSNTGKRILSNFGIPGPRLVLRLQFPLLLSLK